MTPTIRRTLVATLGAAVLALAAPAAIAQSQAQPPARSKVVFQVSDDSEQKWNLALNNARNLQDDLGADNVEMEIVVYGPGIGMLKGNSPVASRIADALKSGVKVVACENTMRAQKLKYDDMLPKIGYVPAGVTELVKKQQEGWSYLRP